MRAVERFIIIISLLASVQGMHGQCSNFVSQYPTGLYSTSNSSWQYLDGCVNGGEYSAYSVVQGANYSWTTCYGSSFNTALTLWNVSHTTSYAYNVNACPNRAQITWTATFTGTVHLLVSRNGCLTNSVCATLYWRMNSPPPAPSNNAPCGALNVANASECNFQTYDNFGATNSGVANPGCGNYNGGDVWYRTTVPTSGSLDIFTEALTLNDAALAAYRGTCSGLILLACDDDSGPGYMPELHLTGLVPGSTLFIRVFSYANSQMGTFNLCIQEPCSVAPSNDIPCNAIALTVGSPVNGTNACSTPLGQPAAPSCFTGGHEGSAWYRFGAPASGSVFIETSLIGIASTQIGLYSGSCASLTPIACNQDKGEGCGNNEGSSSLYYSGLTPGASYYVRVDGEDDDQGSFTLLVGNTLGIVPVPGQDCSSPLDLCSTSVFVPNPGVQGTGNFCDFDGTNNCTNGERNSTWYRIRIGANGNLNFVILPNDGYNNSCGSETDYDFVLWKISGSGSTTDCATMAIDPSVGLAACNYDVRGVTGVSAGGNAPSPYNSCYNPSFEPSVPAINGDVFLLVVQNYTGSTNGFTLDLSSSSPGVVSTPAPDMVYWNGSSGTTWGTSANWGSCGFSPSCTIDATVRNGSTNYPIITGNVNVRDLVILPGGKVTLGPGSRLTLCGTLYNFGELVMDPTATMAFTGSAANQDMKGNLAGLNAIGNLEINKTAGSVNLYSNLEIKGNFNSLSASSIFNTRDNQIDLHKDFGNYDGANTFTGINTYGELNFVGTGAQRYNQGSSTLNLNRVTIDKPSGDLSLSSEMRLKANTGILTLNRGKILTNGEHVTVRNSDPVSVSEGNPNSYIEGILVRFVNNTGLYDFPLGYGSVGFQRARIDFTSNAFSYLTAEFKPWAPIANPLYQVECLGVYDQYPLNHGYFDISANTNPTSALYDMTLYNRGYTNNGLALGWTIMKNSGSGWHLDGNCEPSSASQVTRTGLSGFSLFATAQSSTPLPIELVSFTGQAQPAGNLLQWTTASEVNNELFILESSHDGISFEEVVQIEGANNSSSLLDYEFFHHVQEAGVFYYRLKQRDFDGTMTSSEVIAVERELSGRTPMVFPRPSTGIIYVQLNDVVYTSWSVHDITGRELMSDVLQTGGYLELDLGQLSEGIYAFMLHDREGKAIHIERIVIEK